MAQLIINKDGRPVCRTTVPYDPHTIRAMKRAGYKIKEVPDPERRKDNGKETENHRD